MIFHPPELEMLSYRTRSKPDGKICPPSPEVFRLFTCDLFPFDLDLSALLLLWVTVAVSNTEVLLDSMVAH